MKRSAALLSLSRDHHHALSVAQKMRRASDGEEGARVFLSYWAGHGQAHFRIEEEVLLPGWARLGTVDQAAVGRLAIEHLEIRAGALALAEQRELERVRKLGQRLADHVRFEERELFVLIENDLGSAKLEVLARAMTGAEDQA